MLSNVDVSKLESVKDHPGLLGDRVYIVLRNAILSLEFKPGEIIRKQPICEQLGVSRSPVAEALRRLSDEKLVDVIPQSATRVSKLSVKTIREEAFLREALEVASAARAATERTDKQVARLARNLRMQELVLEDLDLNEFYKYDEEFHELIMECCDISILPATVQSVSLQVTRARLLALPEPGRSSDTVKEHRAILDAIRNQDPAKAVAAMREHLSKLNIILDPLEQEHPEMFSS